MLTVACLLRSGGTYNENYVRRLAEGVGRHGGFELVCMSDMPPPDYIPLGHDWPGWWAKMELFLLPPPVLYFDLDTVIVGDISEIAAAALEHPLILLRDFYRENGFGSGMMAWAADQREIYNAFAADPKGHIGRLGGRGDQGFLEETVARSAVTLWQDILPGQVVSYKAHVRKSERQCETGTGEIPDNARVICFHGKPKPHEVDLWP